MTSFRGESPDIPPWAALRDVTPPFLHPGAWHACPLSRLRNPFAAEARQGERRGERLEVRRRSFDASAVLLLCGRRWRSWALDSGPGDTGSVYGGRRRSELACGRAQRRIRFLDRDLSAGAAAQLADRAAG